MQIRDRPLITLLALFTGSFKHHSPIRAALPLCVLLTDRLLTDQQVRGDHHTMQHTTVQKLVCLQVGCAGELLGASTSVTWHLKHGVFLLHMLAPP